MVSQPEIKDRREEYGFHDDIVYLHETTRGLTRDTIKEISAIKEEPEWMLEWRLKAFRHWQTLSEPTWPNVEYDPIDYQAISYWAAPKKKGDDEKGKEGAEESTTNGAAGAGG